MAEGDAGTGTGAAATGTGAGTGAGGGAAGGGESWTASLPEGIRGHEAWKGVKDVGDLATRYLNYQKPFAEQLPEKIRGEAAFKDIKNLDGLADSYFNAQKMLGVPKDQLLRLPTDDKPESMAPIWEKVNGRPAKPEDYKIEGDPETLKTLLPKAHELGVGQKQLEGLVTWLKETGAAANARTEAAETAERAAAETALKTKLGAAYDQRIGDAVAAIDTLEGKYPGLKAALEKSKLGNLPALNEFFIDYAQGMKEDGKLTGRATGSEALQSPAEARQSIAALTTDANFMASYQKKAHPGHQAAVEKMAALYKLAYPEQGQAA